MAMKVLIVYVLARQDFETSGETAFGCCCGAFTSFVYPIVCVLIYFVCWCLAIDEAQRTKDRCEWLYQYVM